MSEEYVVLIGAGVEQGYVAKHISSLGYGVLMTDMNPQAPGFRFADDFRVASTYDLDGSVRAVREMASGRKIAAVLAVGVDVPLTAATVAQAVGAYHMPLEACRLAMSKLDMQRLMQRNNIPSAAYLPVAVEQKEDLVAADVFARLGEKVVVKPADSRGARGVSVVTQEDQLFPALDRAFPHSQCGTVLIERYLDGPQISGESLIVEGKAYTIGFFDRNYTRSDQFWPLIIEDGAEGPSDYDHLRPETDLLVEKLAAALDISNGIIKTDLVVHEGQVKLIEFALRVSGGFFGTCAVPASTGVDLIRATIDVFKGTPPNPEILTLQEQRGAAIRFWFTPSGTLQEFQGLKTLTSKPGIVHHELLFQPGQELPEIESMVERRGVVVTTGQTKAEAVNRAEEAIAGVKWIVSSA